jgi:hypothetical protein
MKAGHENMKGLQSYDRDQPTEDGRQSRDDHK